MCSPARLPVISQRILIGATPAPTLQSKPTNLKRDLLNFEPVFLLVSCHSHKNSTGVVKTVDYAFGTSSHRHALLIFTYRTHYEPAVKHKLHLIAAMRTVKQQSDATENIHCCFIFSCNLLSGPQRSRHTPPPPY